MRVLKPLAVLAILAVKVAERLAMTLTRSLFKECGRNVRFFPFSSSFSHGTISIGDDVFIGERATFHASDSAIRIGRKVMFGPNVTIMGGNHNTEVVGRYMYDVKTKRPDDDLPVVIEEDVWIASGAIILKGVTIGKGSIVAAGSVVTRSVPPNSIAAGVPARVLKDRFSAEQLLQHRKLQQQNV